RGTVTADDLAAQAPPTGVIEVVEPLDGVTDISVAQTICDAILAERSQLLTEIQYPSDRAGLRVGRQQHVQSSLRDLDDDFLITQLVTRDASGDVLEYEITAATAGGIVQGNWRNTYKSWLGDGGTSILKPTTDVMSGGGAPSPPVRAVQFFRPPGVCGGSEDFLYDYDQLGDQYLAAYRARVAILTEHAG